jgi:Uma2 family endonuclease
VAELARRVWTLDEFLAFDDGTDRRYELFYGQIVARAPASDVHGTLVARLAVRIGGGLRPPCEVVIEAGIVPPERVDSWYEADLAVTCAGLTGQQLVAEPRLIALVLSPSTAATDRDRKLPDYRTIPTLEDIWWSRAASRASSTTGARRTAGRSTTCAGGTPCGSRRSASPSTCASCTWASWLPEEHKVRVRPGGSQTRRALTNRAPIG